MIQKTSRVFCLGWWHDFILFFFIQGHANPRTQRAIHHIPARLQLSPPQCISSRTISNPSPLFTVWVVALWKRARQNERGREVENMRKEVEKNRGGQQSSVRLWKNRSKQGQKGWQGQTCFSHQLATSSPCVCVVSVSTWVLFCLF